ncbi:hypothetical protein MPH_10264 [Macrophomina phaseolina MS6]|uniref:Uncharacterized protein n=1 Tax=Macrophomina phaseolina (strain MS6) TaxID=1126212 RepID=K2RDG6_MACPH|nr:hypothetical protein MPH_10264 [Macrophomina phaseolina MS6]
MQNRAIFVTCSLVMRTYMEMMGKHWWWWLRRWWSRRLRSGPRNPVSKREDQLALSLFPFFFFAQPSAGRTSQLMQSILLFDEVIFIHYRRRPPSPLLSSTCAKKKWMQRQGSQRSRFGIMYQRSSLPQHPPLLPGVICYTSVELPRERARKRRERLV